MLLLLYYIFLIPLLFVVRCIRTQFVLPPTNLDEYDAYGSLLAMNEYLAILAQNDQEYFTIITNQSTKCTLSYDTIRYRLASLTRFVYSVAIGVKQNASEMVFSYINENWRRDVFLTIVFLESINTGCVRAVNRIQVNMTDLNMQEHSLVGMDPYGKRAYAIGTYYIVCVEINTGIRWQFGMEKLFGSQNDSEDLFFPKALVINEDYHMFAVGQRFINFQFLPYLFVLNVLSPSNITLVSATKLLQFNFGPSSIDITRYSTMSISLLDHIEQFIIGIPSLDMLLFLFRNTTNASEEPVIVRTYISSQRGVLFGKSVALLDNNTFAVLAHTLPTPPWSTSQVQIYSLHEVQANSRPLIIYPNNQQIIPSLNFVPPPHSILTVVAWESHLGLVFNAGAALLLSISPPGYYSIPVDDNLFDMDVSISVPCIPGTARNTFSVGPCFLCPPGTKNNGTSGIECETCAKDDASLCLRGSPVEIHLDNITNYNQAVPYPDSPDLVEFDDVLLHNIFTFPTSSSRCLLASPLFWALLAVILGLIMFVIICILLRFPQWKAQRRCLKKVFMHIDLVGEGEWWFGGLVTLAIAILLAFTCKFSISFAQLYPIENIASDDRTIDSCHSTIPNAKFTSGLQLLSILRYEAEKRIFQMLDEQDITLSVQFVSTGFFCRNITMQQNLDRGQRVLSNNFNCSFDEETSILSVNTLLPQHLVTMQFDLIGPYFIGGLRICLSGPSSIDDNDKYTLNELRFCHLFYAVNETLTVSPTIDIRMTKVINRTLGYTISDDITFSGIWVPTLTVSTFSDRLLFQESGEYIRYLSDRITLVVDITESEYFTKNTQEPIARNNEIILHTILFAVVFLELFGLFFLLVKLTVVPLAKVLQRRFLSNRDWSMKNNKEEVQLVRLTQLSVEEVSQKSEVIKNHSRSNSEIPVQTIC